MNPLTWLCCWVQELHGRIQTRRWCSQGHDWSEEPAWSSTLRYCRRCHLSVVRSTLKEFYPK